MREEKKREHFTELLLKKISKEEPEFLKKLRKEYFEKFRSTSLPSKREEEWKYADISKYNLLDLMPDPLPVIALSSVSEEMKKKGIVYTDMKEAIRNHGKILSKWMMSKRDVYDDKFSYLNKTFWNEGVFIYVPKEVKVEAPLITHLLVEGQNLTSTRTLIILEEGAELDYYELHDSVPGKFKALRTDNVEIFLNGNSKLNFTSYQNMDNEISNISCWKAHILEDARINWRFAQFGGEFSRTKIDTYLEGEGAATTTKGIICGTKDSVYDTTANVHHLVPNTIGDILVKSAMAEDSQFIFRGRIKIDKKAKSTNSYLANHNLLLGNGSKVDTIPSLIIETDEVKASHGATIKRIDEEQLFYLFSRGLSKDNAKKMLIKAFLTEPISDIKEKEIRKKIMDSIE